MILFAGGSISNLYAFLAARHQMFPDYKQKGLSCIPGQLVMYTSDQVRHETYISAFISRRTGKFEIWDFRNGVQTGPSFLKYVM